MVAVSRRPSTPLNSAGASERYEQAPPPEISDEAVVGRSTLGRSLHQTTAFLADKAIRFWWDEAGKPRAPDEFQAASSRKGVGKQPQGVQKEKENSVRDRITA